MKKAFLVLSFSIYSLISSFCFSEEYKRDVEYTAQVYEFFNKYYNSEIKDLSQAETLYLDALESVSDNFDEYASEVHFARCDYLMGMYSMGNYDLDSIEKIKSITDTEDDTDGLTDDVKESKAKAAAFFDSGINHAQNALKIRQGSDAYLIYIMCISSNCTVKSKSYVIGNGLKVASNAKKAINLDPKNATAYYFQYAQDLYAPAFFANYKRGYTKMHQFLNDENLNKERFDLFNFKTGIGHSFFKRGDYKQALEWYQDALKLYPGNKEVNSIITRLEKMQ